jgi:hypothetical protein
VTISCLQSSHTLRTCPSPMFGHSHAHSLIIIASIVRDGSRVRTNFDFRWVRVNLNLISCARHMTRSSVKLDHFKIIITCNISIARRFKWLMHAKAALARDLFGSPGVTTFYKQSELPLCSQWDLRGSVSPSCSARKFREGNVEIVERRAQAVKLPRTTRP